jgi:hypothetical protein
MNAPGGCPREVLVLPMSGQWSTVLCNVAVISSGDEKIIDARNHLGTISQ